MVYFLSAILHIIVQPFFALNFKKIWFGAIIQPIAVSKIKISSKSKKFCYKNLRNYYWDEDTGWPTSTSHLLYLRVQIFT